jgi:hypothetical protein
MVRFIAPPGRNYLPNAARFKAAKPATPRSPKATGFRRGMSFMP